MIDNELRSQKIFDINVTISIAMETMCMSHSSYLQETINKQGEETRSLIKENQSYRLSLLRMRVLSKLF